MTGMPLSLRMSGPAAASLLVNALLVAALLNLGAGRGHRRVESPALTVLSLAVTRGVTTGEEKADTATTSPQAAARTSPTPKRIRLNQPPAVEAIPLPTPQIVMPTSLAAAMPVSVADLAPGPDEPAAAQTPSAPPPAARKGAADRLDVSAPSGKSYSYAAKIRSWLYAHKIYPRRARMRREEGRVQVRFVIDRAGTLIEGMVVRSSGHSSLDEEAAAMMQRASPFPKAPSGLAGDRIEFTAPIEFVLPA